MVIVCANIPHQIHIVLLPCLNHSRHGYRHVQKLMFGTALINNSSLIFYLQVDYANSEQDGVKQ